VRLFALAALTALSAGSAALQPAHFVPASGWHTRVGKVHACPGVPASRCVQVFSVASTTPWRDCVGCLPHKTVAAMRAGDIAIQVNVARERRPQEGPAWPPRVTRSKVVAGFEGLPGRVGTFQAYTRAGKREVSVFIVFGRSRPTDRQLQRANTELRRVRFG
jgi:hypothetical protein